MPTSYFSLVAGLADKKARVVADCKSGDGAQNQFCSVHHQRSTATTLFCVLAQKKSLPKKHWKGILVEMQCNLYFTITGFDNLEMPFSLKDSIAT